MPAVPDPESAGRRHSDARRLARSARYVYVLRGVRWHIRTTLHATTHCNVPPHFITLTPETTPAFCVLNFHSGTVSTHVRISLWSPLPQWVSPRHNRQNDTGRMLSIMQHRLDRRHQR